MKVYVARFSAPAYLDKYLAQTRYCGQQTKEEDDHDRKNNLWKPIGGNHGARGDFYKETTNFSMLFAAKKYMWVGLAALGALVAVIGIG